MAAAFEEAVAEATGAQARDKSGPSARLRLLEDEASKPSTPEAAPNGRASADRMSSEPTAALKTKIWQRTPSQASNPGTLSPVQHGRKGRSGAPRIPAFLVSMSGAFAAAAIGVSALVGARRVPPAGAGAAPALTSTVLTAVASALPAPDPPPRAEPRAPLAPAASAPSSAPSAAPSASAPPLLRGAMPRAKPAPAEVPIKLP
jgi:hypothetical protein